ncbi:MULTISPECIES: hypothetical protein [Sutcliffiella]|uniref:hypothetical protein n=1 Tax=Sutcliffiella TaxID=2837511 RepID=UPI0022DE1D96|nr:MULTISPECIES: hypothetical protein [Sutcliffiella]MED4015980.1 hypothetical protein [Sutcliffiella cohnii]WBL14889.1 hypothetical protein O1A01_23975 [Sutcliffiella sp. NC1]
MYVVVGYLALYAVIWLHEVGHGIMYSKYGAKGNPFKVHVPFYLFFSNANPIDIEKAQTLTLKKLYNIGIAGIATNLIFGLPLSFILLSMDFSHTLLYFFIYSFALFHLVEAATYLVISNIFLSSDIVLVQQYKPVLRIPLFIIGLAVTALIFYMIIQSPTNWQIGYIVTIFTMTVCMGLGRMIYSLKNRRVSTE